MRTQLILTTAALGLAGAIGAQAQVYSVNAVGYINLTVPAKKFAMAANQLNTADKLNKIKDVLPGAPDGTVVYKYVRNANGTGQYAVSSAEFSAWTPDDLTLPPGAGFFLYNGGDAAATFTFVGEVPQGALKTPVGAGLNQIASQVPQAGKLATDLAFPAVDGDVVYRFNVTSQAYDAYTIEFNIWNPAEPQVTVGEGIFVSKFAATSWDRTFSVN